MNRKTSKPQPVTLPGMPEQAAASTHLPPQNHLGDLQNALLDWFAANQRRLPWRVNYTPYEVWIRGHASTNPNGAGRQLL